MDMERKRKIALPFLMSAVGEGEEEVKVEEGGEGMEMEREMDSRGGAHSHF
jgi:hypothetical protein